MTDIQTIQLFWRYMVHADRDVLAASATVSDEGFVREQNISFGSIHKLLHHAMLAQKLWIERLNGNDAIYPSDAVPVPRAELPAMWSAVHDGLLAYANAQTSETLQQTIRATSRIGKKFEIPKWAVMMHVADHATYHRGQLNSMIKLAGGKPSNAMVVPWAVSQGFGKAIE